MTKSLQQDSRFGNISMDLVIPFCDPPYLMQQMKKHDDCTCKFYQIMNDFVENNMAGYVGKYY